MKIDEIVEKYIALRDRKSQYKAEYEAKVSKIDEVLDKVEGALLKHFEAMGVENVRTKAGTAYKSTRTSATVADWDSFLGFVQQQEAWEMLEHRVSKKAVEEYKAANEDLPPGVNWRAEVVVNVKR
jgi:hypothetical protein